MPGRPVNSYYRKGTNKLENVETMQQALILSLCALVALVAAWSLIRASRTGRISSRGWTFQRDESPVGFWFIAITDFGILAASLGFALHALGLIGDLPTSMTIRLPRYH
jgi:hypothetical protein